MKECNGMIVYPKDSPKIAFEGKHIYIYEEKPNPKTKVWSIIFGGSCFYEIAEFCKEQTQLQRNKK